MEYYPTIGLEIHAELKTATKMFCDCPNDSPRFAGEAGPDEQHPNINVCPVCLGHPGALPVPNKKALEFMVKIGFAVGGKINKNFKFDRKNYFYPDLPKGYQISQFDLPIVAGGNLDISARFGNAKIVKLNRVHLEEDAARLMHESSPDLASGERYSSSDARTGSERASLVDFNRGGVPLMELVSEPDMHSAEEAVAFAKELQLILRYLEVSGADLERGQMRFDANVSLSETADIRRTDAETRGKIQRNSALILRESATLGTKVEVKNLNSFAALEEAINFEIKRQEEILENGEKVKQETRGWDDGKKKTESQRSKEEAHDYRYFPEPDIPPFSSDGFDLERLKLEVPELPNDKRKRFKEQFNLNDEQANILAEDRREAEYFENAVSEIEADIIKEDRGKDLPAGRQGTEDRINLLFNYLNSDLKGLMKENEVGFSDLKIDPENFADLVEMIAKKEISSRTAKDLLVRMFESGIDPREIVKQEGLGQVSDEGELLEVVRKILSENPKAVEDYKKGKANALQFMVGKAIGALKGKGNPAVLKFLFEKELK